MKMTSSSSSLLISLLLLLSILVHEAQGIRLDKGSSLSAKLHKFQEDILRSLRRRSGRSMDGNVGVLEGTNNNLSCKGKYSLRLESSGRNRKLMMMMTKTTTSSTSSTTTDSKNSNYDNGNKRVESYTLVEGRQSSSLSGKEENFSGNPSTMTSKKQQPENTNISHVGHYSPDIFDLAGMDYSPASRKRPIHN